MIESGFIAAIDLGTSKITGVVARKNEDNVISVMGCETTRSQNCIRRGLVYNIEKTGANVRKVISKLENKLGKKIAKVYVSVAGQSLHTITHTVYKQLSSSGIVTDSVILQMHKEANAFKPDMSKLYDIADVEYIINGKAESQPVGVATTEIEGNYQMIVGRPNISTNIKKSIEEKAGLEIAGYVIGPLASANITLSDNDKELGCAFVDFGAGTSSLLIYKDGKLRHMAVIPFGGDTITKDICELNFTEEDAETYKTDFGKAYEVKDTNTSRSSGNKSSGIETDLPDLNHVIEMRIEEIVVNIEQQIKLSGYEGRLGAGMVITGGGSKLVNLNLYLENKLEMPVRKASAQKAYINNFPELANNPSLTQALGLLLYASVNCEKEVVEEPEKIVKKPVKETVEPTPKTPKRGFRDRFGDLFGSIGTMFEDEEEDN